MLGFGVLLVSWGVFPADKTQEVKKTGPSRPVFVAGEAADQVRWLRMISLMWLQTWGALRVSSSSASHTSLALMPAYPTDRRSSSISEIRACSFCRLCSP